MRRTPTPGHPSAAGRASSGLLRRLHALRGQFGLDADREKRAILTALARTRWRSASALRDWHDELLFLIAFPDSPAILRGARRALAHIEHRVAQLPRRERTRLVDSGIAGTTTTNAFMYGAARWLAHQGQRITFDWARDTDAERLDSLLRLSLTSAEGDLFDSGEVDSRTWLRHASRLSRDSDAGWLLRSAPDASASPLGDAWRVLYDAAEVPLRWDVADSRFAATHCIVPVAPVYRTGFRTLLRDVSALIATPLPGIRRLRGAEAERWHDASLAALTVRAREVFPTTYANRAEMYLAPLGEGVALCVLGVPHRDRAAIEANYGYVMFANGVPIGYGGVTPLGDQANTGANIFASFRRSEAAFVFAQALRAFHTMFGVRRFIVNPYQIGEDNDEAIESGAYWFYDRLGFRPSRTRLAALARRERAAMRVDPAHRSSRRTLRALARGDVVLTLDDGGRGHNERMLLDVGRVATTALSTVPANTRVEWIRSGARRLLHGCTGERRALSSIETRGAMHLAPVLMPLAGRIARWPRVDRFALWKLVQLKGADQERAFARESACHSRLWRALAALH